MANYPSEDKQMSIASTSVSHQKNSTMFYYIVYAQKYVGTYTRYRFHVPFQTNVWIERIYYLFFYSHNCQNSEIDITINLHLFDNYLKL